MAEVLAEGSKHAFYLSAEGLPPTHGFFYAVWLDNSPTEPAYPSAGAPPVELQRHASKAAGRCPPTPATTHEILITRGDQPHTARSHSAGRVSAAAARSRWS